MGRDGATMVVRKEKDEEVAGWQITAILPGKPPETRNLWEVGRFTMASSCGRWRTEESGQEKERENFEWPTGPEKYGDCMGAPAVDRLGMGVNWFRFAMHGWN